MARGSGGVSFPVARCGFDPRRRADKDLRNLELELWQGLALDLDGPADAEASHLGIQHHGGRIEQEACEQDAT
jgi:hypothetical protein